MNWKKKIPSVGGKVTIDFGDNLRLKSLVDELLGFYAEIHYGDKPIIIDDESTPTWTRIITFNMRLFTNKKILRFDVRYNRKGNGIGGGVEIMMFGEMLKTGIIMKYLPYMGVLHYVEFWRMSRCDFLRLHSISSKKLGKYKFLGYIITFFDIPPFLVTSLKNKFLNH